MFLRTVKKFGWRTPQDGTVSIIDVASKQVRETLAADVGGANRLKFTLDGKLALISSLRSADVTVIDTATHKTDQENRSWTRRSRNSDGARRSASFCGVFS